MRILTTTDIREAGPRARIFDYLLRDETTHCLLLQNPELRVRQPAPGSSATRFWAVEWDGEIVGVAAWTPPFSLLLSRVTDDSAIQALADAVLEEETLPLGLLAPDPVAGRFADEWARHLLADHRVAMREGVYDLEIVRDPHPVSGAVRLATTTDRTTLIDVAREFIREALTEREQKTADPTKMIDDRFQTPNWWMVWEDAGEIVSIASANGETPHAMRIGPVFTLPRHRRRGYASALTAAIARRILALGYRRAMLCTDLANPTSNGIYRAIGFRPVAEFSLIAFTPRKGPDR